MRQISNGVNLTRNNQMVIPKKVTKAEWLILCITIASALLSFIALRAQAVDDGFVRIYFLDVGQGDAIFIQNFNGNQVLIDGGPDSRVSQELSKIMPFNDRSIDMIVLTHPHADHLIGLIDILKRYQINQILENNYEYQSAEYDEWNKLKSNATVTQAVTGQIINLGGGAKLEVIYPDVNNAGKKISNPNNASIVLRLEYGSESVLLAGDIEATIEKKLSLNGSKIDADFLKVAHHGSKTSTSEQFLDTVTPVEAFIEIGEKNKFGHPSQNVIDELENRSIKYHRTDINGNIELILDGQGYQVIYL